MSEIVFLLFLVVFLFHFKFILAETGGGVMILGTSVRREKGLMSRLAILQPKLR